MNANGKIIEKVAGSKIYQQYERAFCETTGLPVTLRPVESWKLPHHGKRNESPFCCLMSQKSRSCAACLQTQQKLAERATDRARSVTCAHGLVDTAVPVKLGNELLGFLQTGQVFHKAPSEAQFERTAGLAKKWGLPVEKSKLREAYLKSRVVTPQQHNAVIKLLTIFAEHLGLISNRIVVEQENSESPVITKAKEYIHQKQGEELTLGEVAKAVNTSCFYFCKLFKKATGLTFTNYLSRVRIEKAKNLLLNPNLRVSEIGYEVGFQSLTHFNRVFKKTTNQSPSAYRAQLKCA
jgi:AraC-like DNA-binding protein